MYLNILTRLTTISFLIRAYLRGVVLIGGRPPPQNFNADKGKEHFRTLVYRKCISLYQSSTEEVAKMIYKGAKRMCTISQNHVN